MADFDRVDSHWTDSPHWTESAAGIRAASLRRAPLVLLPAMLLLAALLLAGAARADARLVTAARGGDAEAAEHLALLYETGSGMPRNESEAAYWYGRAAKAGRRNAQFAYAQFLETGTGLTKDEAVAAQWYLAAARQGHAGAVVNLAAMLATGRVAGAEGAAEDRASAYRLLLWAQELRGQASMQATVAENLKAVGAGLRRSQRTAAKPLDPKLFDLAAPKPLASR